MARYSTPQQLLRRVICMWIPRCSTTGATLNDIVIKGDNLTAGATDFIASSANFEVQTRHTADYYPGRYSSDGG